jgi:hypothetical protein
MQLGYLRSRMVIGSECLVALQASKYSLRWWIRIRYAGRFTVLYLSRNLDRAVMEVPLASLPSLVEPWVLLIDLSKTSTSLTKRPDMG